MMHCGLQSDSSCTHSSTDSVNCSFSVLLGDCASVKTPCRLNKRSERESIDPKLEPVCRCSKDIITPLSPIVDACIAERRINDSHGRYHSSEAMSVLKPKHRARAVTSNVCKGERLLTMGVHTFLSRRQSC